MIAIGSLVRLLYDGRPWRVVAEEEKGSFFVLERLDRIRVPAAWVREIPQDEIGGLSVQPWEMDSGTLREGPNRL